MAYRLGYRSKWGKFCCILSKFCTQFFTNQKPLKFLGIVDWELRLPHFPRIPDWEFPMALHQWSHKSHYHLTSTEWTDFPSLFSTASHTFFDDRWYIMKLRHIIVVKLSTHGSRLHIKFCAIISSIFYACDVIVVEICPYKVRNLQLRSKNFKWNWVYSCSRPLEVTI